MSLSKYVKKVVCLSPRASVLDASHEMKEKGVGTIVVISDDYKPIGLLTDRDITTRIVAERRSPETTLEEAMTTNLVSLFQDTSIQKATELMRDRGVRRIPILDENGRVSGIVSMDDLLLLLGMEIGNLASAIVAEMQRLPGETATAQPDV
jgi:CBS domain-containing protein